MTELAPGTHVVYPNPLAPWCSHRGVVYDVNRDDSYDVKSYGGLDVLHMPLEDLHVVPVPTGRVEIGTHVVAMSVEYPPDMAPDPYARHAVGVAVSVGSTHVRVRSDQQDEGIDELPVDAVFALPAAETYVPSDGDEVFLSVRGDGSDEDGETNPVHGNVLAVSASGEALVLTVLGQRMVDPALLAVDDRVEPGTWVVLSDGETGAVTRCELFRTDNRRHAWGYTYTVASPVGRSQEFKVWSGEQFDGFLVASIESERIPSTVLPLGSTSELTARPVRT
ncbi:hypothetical protein [Microlunatus antarcticus]|uniref:Uncharacterized protein n=1 Tax=Microlunatus antarcticus TaxID=53388 RepID=A0A7W5P6I8_9ACTN|nr:hypothetical protein [Microlunatus antarcticus]MBB3326483.1 hypothetical protein [Microlunatus antarcticus]